MAVEDAFDIQLEDSEAEKLLTPGQLIDFIMSKVATTSVHACLTLRSFNLLRRFFTHRCALDRKQVRLETPLRTAFPRVHRQAWIQQLSIDLAIKSPPRLVRPKWLEALLFAAASIAGLAAAISFTHSQIPFWLPGLLAVAATAAIGVAFTRNCRTEFPKELGTVGQLAYWIMAHKSDFVVSNTGWTREQVAAQVREIVINILGCDSTYREDARFVQDLGMG